MDIDKIEQVVEYSIIEANLAELKKTYWEIPSMEDKEGRAFIRSGIAHIRWLRSTLETKRKELKADSIAWGRMVDGEAKRIKNELLSIETPLKSAKEEYDLKIKAEKEAIRKAEESRVSAIQDKINGVRLNAVGVINLTASDLYTMLENTINIVIDQSYQEFRKEAEAEKGKTVAALKYLLEKAQDREAENERLAKERREEEVRRQEEAEKRRAEEERLAKERQEFLKEKSAFEEAKKREVPVVEEERLTGHSDVDVKENDVVKQTVDLKNPEMVTAHCLDELILDGKSGKDIIFNAEEAIREANNGRQ